MENELSESKSEQITGGYADLWGLMVVGDARVVGSGESKGRLGLEYTLGVGVRQRESNNNNS